MISENCCAFVVLNYEVVQTIIAMFTEDKVTEIFFMADEFHKVFCRMLDKYSLNAPKMTGKRPYHRAGKLSVPEILTIMILFHNSGYRYLNIRMRSALTFATCFHRSSPTIASWNWRRRRSYRSQSLSRRYFWENAPASVSLTPRLCVCARTSASISIRLSKALQPEASARWGGFSVSSYT